MVGGLSDDVGDYVVVVGLFAPLALRVCCSGFDGARRGTVWRGKLAYPCGIMRALGTDRDAGDEFGEDVNEPVFLRGDGNRGGDRIVRGPGCLGGCAILLFGLLVGVVLMVMVGRMVLPAGEGMVHRIAQFLVGRRTTIDVSSAAVVERIQRLSRLETVVYSLDKIVVGQRESNVLPNALVGDKLLLIAHGEVVAGIDLSGLKPGDVTVQGDHVSLRLPQPIVLSTRLDNQKTRVFSRVTGMLVMADPNLETEVRKAAESQIEQAAIQDGILDKAKTNAKASLETLLYGLGFHSVEIQ